MKSSRILLSVFAAALVMGCSEYDDSALWKKVDEAQKQLAELSASLTQLEGQVALLTAAKTGGVITDIKENPDGGVTVTYTTADSTSPNQRWYFFHVKRFFFFSLIVVIL